MECPKDSEHCSNKANVTHKNSNKKLKKVAIPLQTAGKTHRSNHDWHLTCRKLANAGHLGFTHMDCGDLLRYLHQTPNLFRIFQDGISLFHRFVQKETCQQHMSLKQLQCNQQGLCLGIFRPKGVAAEKMRS